MKQNLYQPINGGIVDIIDESPTIKSFVVVLEEAFRFETGQFVELTLPGVGEAPFTPSSSPYDTKKMEITIMKAGHVTALLHECEKGQKIGIRGPYGRGYPVEDFVGKDVYIIGGGVGLAPIRSLFLTLVDRIEAFNSVVCRFGAKTPDDFIYKNTLFDSWQKIDGVDIKLTVDNANGNRIACSNGMVTGGATEMVMARWRSRWMISSGPPANRNSANPSKRVRCPFGVATSKAPRSCVCSANRWEPTMVRSIFRLPM